MLSTLPLVFLRLFFLLLKDCWGVFNSPYQTLRKIAKAQSFLPVLFFALLSWLVLALATVTKNGLHTGPLFLTFNLGKLFYATTVTYIIAVVAIYFVGRLVGGKGKIAEVVSVWSFSYLPTVLWFTCTTILYVLLPPPRTTSWLGQTFSIFFLFLSLGLLFWKGLLYFLTLRLALGLTLWQMIRATMILWPIFFFYFLLLNRMGIFKIPFA